MAFAYLHHAQMFQLDVLYTYASSSSRSRQKKRAFYPSFVSHNSTIVAYYCLVRFCAYRAADSMKNPAVLNYRLNFKQNLDPLPCAINYGEFVIKVLINRGA